MGILGVAATRVMDHTDPDVNRRILRQSQANVTYYGARPEEIDRRLQELDEEWDIERWLEINSAAISLVGLGLAATRSRWFLLLPLTVQGFFLQHALQGWCPPLPIFRRLGVRTQAEIQAERNALKALKGENPTILVRPPAGALRTDGPGSREDAQDRRRAL